MALKTVKSRNGLRPRPSTFRAGLTSESGASPVLSDIDLTKMIRSPGDQDSLYFSTLWCGKAGSGKTHSLGTWPGPIVILNADYGLRTLSHRTDITVVDVKRGDPAHLIALALIWAIRDNEPPFDKIKPKTFAIDSVTALSTLLEFEIFAAPPILSDQKEVKERNETLWQGDYNIIKNRLIKIFTEAKALRSVYFVATAGLSYDKDDATGELFENPDVTGRKFGPILPHSFDYVLLSKRDKEGGYYARTIPSSRFPHAKGRIPGGVVALPETIPDPTFSKIVELSKEPKKVASKKK